MINDKKQLINKIKQTMYISPKSKKNSMDVKETVLELLVEMHDYLGKGIDKLSDKKRK